MTVLVIRTDKPDAEIGLFENGRQLDYETWKAHMQLSMTIHSKIRDLLARNDKVWQSIDGVVCFSGPGSFTGLRIGATVANTIGVTLKIPVVGSSGQNWVQDGLSRLKTAETDSLVIPLYGRGPHITARKK